MKSPHGFYLFIVAEILNLTDIQIPDGQSSTFHQQITN